jgi:hypothetical protein
MTMTFFKSLYENSEDGGHLPLSLTDEQCGRRLHPRRHRRYLRLDSRMQDLKPFTSTPFSIKRQATIL